jgi:hypothetical protein
MKDISIDVPRVLGTLKDFQLQSVDYIFRRMYLDVFPAQRFLLADEVGLGKTMVARGVIARAIDHLKDKVDRIDILYICSNHDIARQNIARLNVTPEDDFSLASRITLLPQTVKDLKGRRLNFITFTPGTSFELASNLGTAAERALLHQILTRAWGLRGTGALNLLQGNSGTERFRERASELRDAELDDSLIDAFKGALEATIEKERAQGAPDIRTRFETLCSAFAYARTHIPPDEHRKRIEMVGELRGILAASCIEALEPDLIILDEFQRFRDLLDGNDDASVLARNLFNYKNVRVLLLSATPYKMYTLTDDSAGEDHYKDFVRTYRFLSGDDKGAKELESLLASFRRELVGSTSTNLVRLRELKSEIEARLRLVMCRTERLASDAHRNGMLVQMPPPITPMSSTDLNGYVSLQNVADALGEGDILEYWKSTPFALNFMETYKLKKLFDDATSDTERRANISRLLTPQSGLFLDWKSIEGYSAVDPANARLRYLAEDTLGRGAWKTLWMPPALPYYRPGKPFDTPELKSFTKRLVFSCWKVVPKVIAAMLSYEAERLMTMSSAPDTLNTQEERKKRRPLLRYAVSDDRPTGMPILALTYPSEVLAKLCDPLELASLVEAAGLPEADLVLDLAILRIQHELSSLERYRAAPKEGPEDESWYWAAPLLLDRRSNAQASDLWWTEVKGADLAAVWSEGDVVDENEAAEDDGSTASAWSRHIDEARKADQGLTALGRPPADLPRVLALMGIAAPGPVALRALGRVAPTSTLEDRHWIRLNAAPLAFRFPALFNQPESMALVRGINGEEPYWRRVLDYCVAGNLQAVMDEYCHLLKESLGLVDKPVEDVAYELTAEIVEAMSLRAALVGVDCVQLTDSGKSWKSDTRRMRMRFALRYGDEKSEDGQGARADQVRTAFNSPFWPFVLATTSVGQEGLDFHHYCHAVVHWNLPSNPVDLEQREGRVHRYKGHAVRKNLTSIHGPAALASLCQDPWQKMFDLACTSRLEGASEISPFWLLPLEGGAHIERHVLTLPLSREIERLSALRGALAIYRMVFGQPRQEELLEYLSRTVSAGQLHALADELRVDLSPPIASPPS